MLRRGKKLDSKTVISSSQMRNPFIKLGAAWPERFLLPAVSCASIAEETQMALNTTSFLAGVGSVVAVLSTGLAGGYFLATPSHIDAPNRLQRVAANQDSKPVPVATDAKPADTKPADSKPEIVAAAAPTATPSPAAEQTAKSPTPATAAPAVQPVVAPPEAKASEPAPATAIHEAAAPTAKPDADAKTSDARTNVEKVNADKARAAEARSADLRAAAEKKRTETRKIAEQQRKQRELEVATIAVRRIIHERDSSDVVVESDRIEAPAAAEMPHFNLFGQ
jgi:hypothetical protein